MLVDGDAAVRERYAAGVKTEVHIARLRAEVASLHAELARSALIGWAGGNVSLRLPGAELFVITPALASPGDLAPESTILCDLNGNVVAGTPGSEGTPSPDTAAHAYVYRNLPDVGAVVHTHSDYAAAWAARGEEIPCVLTVMAAEFGGPIPVGPFATIGDDAIGRAVVAALAGHRSPAVLMQNHGPVTIGSSGKAAVRAAVMVEQIARTVHIARQGGELIPLPQAEIDRLYRGTNARQQATDDRR